MERGDICPYCMDADCPSTKTQCPGRAGEPAPAVTVMCGFCFDSGGHRVPCHGCGVVGPVTVRR